MKKFMLIQAFTKTKYGLCWMLHNKNLNQALSYFFFLYFENDKIP